MKPEVDLLYYEKEAQKEGFKLIAGTDEVGRGPLAGPVACCACIMNLSPEKIVEGVWDSKKLSPKKRDELYEKIKENAIAYKVEFLSEKVIDEINILEATKRCMANAINGLSVTPDIVLVDAVKNLDAPVKQRPLIHGDAISYTIGCASILAKVERDRFMDEMDKIYPGYGFAKHKGYGTKQHIEAIKALGPSVIHRKTFIKHFVEGTNE